MAKRESKFQGEFIKTLRRLFPDAIIVKGNADYLQGVPDILMLIGNTWAAFECKRSRDEEYRPNQRYYVGKMHDMSYAAFVYPENEDDVLNDLQRTFRPSRQARVSRR